MKLRHSLVARGAAVSSVLAAVAIATAPVALAAGTFSGLSFIINPDTNQNLNSGGSQTLYGVKVNPGSACPADSSQGYTVFGYITDRPDPENLSWSSIGPSSPTGATYPLIDEFHSPYNGRPTQVTTGEVLPTGRLTFSDFTITDLPAGNYHIGLACVLANTTMSRFFDTQIVINADPSAPGGFTWVTNPNPQVPESPLALALPITAGLVLAGSVFVIRRRRTSPVPTIA